MKWYAIADASDEVLEALAAEFEMGNPRGEGAGEEFTRQKAGLSRPATTDKATDEITGEVTGEATAVAQLLSLHAQLRVRQRGLSLDDVAFILGHGTCEQVAAATIYFLRANDIAGHERALYQRLVGTAVVTAPDRDQVITVWRNRKHGLRNLRQKRQQQWHSVERWAA